jgi:chromosomal replication initiation ATPase DnaA
VFSIRDEWIQNATLNHLVGHVSIVALLIYGNGGLGKTHLANAIGIEVKNLFP